MSEAKTEMYGSYLAIFSFACVMILLQLFFDSKLGAVLWTLVAWHIYRRRKPVLVMTLKLLFWLIIGGGIGCVIWLIFDSGNADLLQFVQNERLGLAVSAGLFWWLRSYFSTSPTAADVFGAKPAPADAPLAAAFVPAPELQMAHASADMVAGTPPVRPAGNIRSWVNAGAKQVMFWRKIRAQPASSGKPPAAAVAVAARPAGNPSTPANQTTRPDAAAKPAKAGHTAATAAPAIADAAPPPPVAAPKTKPAPPVAPIPVASPPEIKAAPVNPPKMAAPEIPGTPPAPPVIDDDVMDRIYARIAEELETGSMTKGLWTRLYAECDGDEKRAKVLYIRQRAEKLIAAELVRRPK